jgi:hypothetical protein
LLCRSSLVWCSPMCSFFLLDIEPFCVSFGKHIPYTYPPQCIPYCLLELFQSFWPYIKVYDPLWVDFGTG